MNEFPENRISATAIREEVERILQSPIFAQSDRLSRFLRYTVEHVISGSTESLKEYVIGTEVYDRKPPYHPSQDSIVRTEARRLRSKLKEYYGLDGKDDPVFIFFRPGSYAPMFRMKDSEQHNERIEEAPRDELFVEGAGVQVAVIPFLDLSGKPVSSRFALGVTDELVHELMQSQGCRVVSVSSIAHLGPLASDVPLLAQKLGVQFIFEGTVREEGNRIRVTGRIVNADGFQLWSQRLDAEADPAKEFEIQEQFASSLVSRVRPQASAVLAEKASVGPLLLSVYPAVLRAESLVEESTTSDVQTALVRFREVAQIAPSFARPFCGIARCHLWMALHGNAASAEHAFHARAAADRALTIDPKMADVLTSIGSVQALEWRWEEAEVSLRIAAAYRPHAAGNRQLAMLLTLQGRFDEACIFLDSAQRIDPFSYLQKASRMRFLYLSKRWDEASDEFSEPLRHGPIPLQAQLDLALVYGTIGKFESAKALAEQAQRCAGADLPTLAVIAEIYAKSQDRQAAELVLEQFGLLNEDVDLSKYRQARLAAALDRGDTAVAMLAASYTDKEPELPFIAIEPAFDSIRQTVAFDKLVGKIWLANVVPEHTFLTVS